MIGPLSFNKELSDIPIDPKERHEEFVDLFGHFIFWLRNDSINTSRTFVESMEFRERLGTIRRECYEKVAKMPESERELALLLAEETLNGFLERLLWCLGDEGTDARFGMHHAYRFIVKMEILDIESEKVVETETINRGGKFFGKYWGRWLNRHQK